MSLLITNSFKTSYQILHPLYMSSCYNISSVLSVSVLLISLTYLDVFPNLNPFSWLSPRPISTVQLSESLHLHLQPINLVVFKGSYWINSMGYLILREASRLDAFSVYPVPTWLLGYEIGISTDSPEVSPSRSSRTKDSSSQISYAHAG